MANGTPIVIADDRETSGIPRTRDADATRQALLRAARRRFALDGYSSTTVRQIATDAGVNVALINRYFDSKEGLFEACLARAATGVDRTTVTTLAGLAQSVAMNLVAPADDESLELLLFLRTSGDERADRIRLNTLGSYAKRIAALADQNETDDRDLLIRAQLVISMALGIALLRVSGGGLEPLSTVSADALAAPLRDVFTALLARP